MTVRVRYGPSPTGDPHVGNIRTALFDWLFARHHGGAFIVRIEDTDQKRSVEGAEERILQALRWLGLDWDEGPDVGGPHGPYHQSQRLPLYQARGRAAAGLRPGLSMRPAHRSGWTACARPSSSANSRPVTTDTAATSPNPTSPPPSPNKPVAASCGSRRRGTASPSCRTRCVATSASRTRLLDDHVLLKADGFPTYHLASVVDDHAMAISHVFRGDEWLSSAPRHLLLYAALGYDPPIFVHQPVILGPDKGKLSKRHGATAVLDYAAKGYLPEALINFLALLGWSKDDHTTKMSVAEIIEAFDIDRMGVTPSTFDHDRLDAMNADFIRDLTPQAFFDRARPFLDAALPAAVPRPVDTAPLLPLAPMIQERVKLLTEVPGYVDFFFATGPLEYPNADLMGKGFRDHPSGAPGPPWRQRSSP